MSKLLISLTFFLVLALTACTKNSGIICDESAVAGLNVYVHDAETLYPLIQGVTVQAFFQNEIELLNAPISDGSPFFGAFEKPGVFTVIVSKPEYRSDTISPVYVEKGQCHVKPVVLRSKLRKN
jgi:hypothetical protein